MKDRFWLLTLLVVSALPSFIVLLRGTVWGADSFAFWAFSCGRSLQYSILVTPDWLLSLILNVINCNLGILSLITWFLYFLALLGLYFFAKKWFGNNAWLVPLYAASLTPLFFIEAMRFENDFFGWSMAFIALGLFAVFLERKNYLAIILGLAVALERKNYLAIILSLVVAFFSIQIWFPSVFVLFLAVFLLRLDKRVPLALICIGIIGLILFKLHYFLGSFEMLSSGQLISEEVPLIGLVFVLHILHFWKHIPSSLKIYGVLLLFLGAVKSKYMFLATPLLLMGLLSKEKSVGLSIPKLGIDKVPVLFFVVLLTVGWIFMGLNMYPTQSDLKEMEQYIKLTDDANQQLYNDWGDGWTFVYLGKDTNYKISTPQPDWNNIKRPFLAWSKTELLDCNKVTKKIQQC